MNDGLELGVRQNPQQVVQNEEQLGRQDITVLYLNMKVKCHRVNIVHRSPLILLTVKG